VAKGKRLKKDLTEHNVVGLDTGVFIHHFEGGEYSELTTIVLERVQDGGCKGVVSAVSLAEVLVKPLQLGLESLADLYRVVFHEMPNLQTVPVDQDVASRAASLRAVNGLGPADSIVMATAIEAGATAFVTTRQELKVVKGLRIMVLSEYL
jgi:predicted nucleic acid-binding protein